MQIPLLETRRLRLEPLAPEHSVGMFELWRSADVCEHSGAAVDSSGAIVPLPVGSPGQSDRILEYWLDRARAGSGFRWAVLLRGQRDFIGAIGFNSLGRASELAYHLIPAFWGSGFATEACRAALGWSLSQGIQRVSCEIEPANTRSLQLARALGFRPASGARGDGARTHLLDLLDRSESGA